MRVNVDHERDVELLVQVNVDHERHVYPLADHMTQLRNFTKGEIRFQRFYFHFN